MMGVFFEDTTGDINVVYEDQSKEYHKWSLSCVGTALGSNLGGLFGV